MGGPGDASRSSTAAVGCSGVGLGRQLTLWSRNSGDPGPVPELTRAAGSLPANTLIDGETVICDESG